MPETFESHWADLDGPVHYADFGGTGPNLVCLHGAAGSHLDWLLAGPLLAEHGRVLAPDLVAHGHTPLDGRRATVGGHRRLLARFLDEVVGGPTVLVGNSLGGLLAVLQAHARPVSVTGVVLVDPAIPAASRHFSPGVAVRASAAMLPVVGRRLLDVALARLGAERLVAEALALATAHPERLPQHVVDARVELTRARSEYEWNGVPESATTRSLALLLTSGRRVDQLLDELATPTLLIHGRKDILVPIEAAEALARRRPDWTVRYLDDVGHMPQLEAPDEFVAVVTAWLAGAGAAARDRAVAAPSA